MKFMNQHPTDPLGFELDGSKPLRQDYRIGIAGAGFIIRDVQLPAYRKAGFPVVAIASRTPEVAHEVADRHAIPRVYETVDEMLEASGIDILDIAVPPDQQPDIIRRAVAVGKLKGILAHKPLATTYADAVDIVRLCSDRGIQLAVNQNMRFDQSIRALKRLLEQGQIGEPVLATIEMRAKPHWQPWLQGYNRLTLLNMSVHHLDCFRFLFGDPESIYVSARTDPRTKFAHRDGICLYFLEYAEGLRAAAWDDVWVGPANSNDELGAYVKWRVEGTAGTAHGTLGWPAYPNRCRSTLEYSTLSRPGVWLSPSLSEVWFPDAFQGPMASLMDSIARGVEPGNSGRDNLATMALVECGYLSLDEHRPVHLEEITGATVPGNR
jgi:hypothetical protein